MKRVPNYLKVLLLLLILLALWLIDYQQQHNHHGYSHSAKLFIGGNVPARCRVDFIESPEISRSGINQLHLKVNLG